ncbi:hypothetical protein NHX12_029788 [Muraenolepis orangiensis]|uniref:Protein SFI1 homolog n=1 Tax=Muraenolepis orangiensis TaxID=630683 RepID=A0A9Q0EAI3_9TELE|nr:hypothetical protein NHX12_029788 [Muraenolepis orangiensis]
MLGPEHCKTCVGRNGRVHSSAGRTKRDVCKLHNIWLSGASSAQQWRAGEPRAGLRGLSLNVRQSKTHRQNKNVAVQHLQQTIKSKYWRLWHDCLEEKEEKFLYPQLTTAQTYYSNSLTKSMFYLWKERLVEHRYLQGLEHIAKGQFAQRTLPQCVDSWVEYTSQTRLHRRNKEMAEAYNRRWQHNWVFYTWWGRSHQSREQKLGAKRAVLRHKRCCLQRAWGRWKRRTRQQMDEGEKSCSADHLYRRTLLQNTTGRWKDKSQREESSRLDEMRRHHEVKLVKHSIQAWKEYHQQTGLIDGLVEDRYKLHMQRLLSRVLTEWKENATSLSEARVKEQRALSHFHNGLQLKDGFKRWRLRTKEVLKDQTGMEKAVQHHHGELLASALTSWNTHHRRHQKNEVMKQQGMLLLTLKMYQKYFAVWQMELGGRRREAEKTAISLWHWSLGLQSKVVYAWRLWVSEQRRKRERLARGAQFSRDQLLREGVRRILEHSAHMSSLAVSQAPHSQQTSQRLQRTVRRCAWRWKQRALCNPQGAPQARGPQPKQKKNVTFSCPTPALTPEDEAPSRVIPTRQLRPQPRRHEEPLESLVKELGDVGSEGPPLISNTTASNSCPGDGSLLPPDQIRHHSITATGSHMTPGPVEDIEVCGVKEKADPALALTEELLHIQVEMNAFQRDRRQLCEDDHAETSSVRQELAELEENIDRLSEDLAKQRPAMVLHTARIQHLDSVLQSSGVALHSSGHALHSSGHALHSSGHALHSSGHASTAKPSRHPDV